MRNITVLLFLKLCLLSQSFAQNVLEPFSYAEDFEDRELGAWASYPLWQDTAYDPNFRVNEIIPRDSNISIVQKVTPYTNVDNYAGAQKLMDIYLTPGSTVSLRYYLKTNLDADFFKIRFAAGDLGKLDITFPKPETNKWVPLSVKYDDLLRENPALKDKENIRIYALAVLTKIPSADPDMPIYLGLDDIKVQAQKAMSFQFETPDMFKLPEFEQYIPQKHYTRGDQFTIKGTWPLDAQRVEIEIASITDSTNPVFKSELEKRNNKWSLDNLELSYPDGLYIGKLTALNGGTVLSQSKFTIHIAPEISQMAGKHPRLLFDAEEKKAIDARFKEDRFSQVSDNIVEDAKNSRERYPLESLIYDLDQFPDEVWLPSWSSWVSHIFGTAGTIRSNAMAYAFLGDREAGLYVKEMLITLSGWPDWSHPWQIKRGRYSEHNTGSWSHRMAEAYDLIYDLMSPSERQIVREAIIQNIIKNGFQTYVYNDNITSKTSNWLAMILGGSLMNMAAIYADGPETENLEPYFTGTLLKYHQFLGRVTDNKDGSWGEGLGYNNYSMSNLSYSMPSLNNVFNIDVSEVLVNTYNEYIWAGLVKDRKWFDFGDSTGDISPVSNWAYLLNAQKEPRLGWYYNYLKNGEDLSSAHVPTETFQDILYDTKNVERDSPFDENPVKAFHHVGTTVFKSGWDKDDFVFVMRTGPFFNHQHLDQGSFYLADRGHIFIEDRHLYTSDYYEDPIYQSWHTQPIAHSTILINDNHQSQRVGDPVDFAPGFDDHAFIAQFLDGENAAFSSGDIGRLYWQKVKSLSRNVLYLKPRTVLMIDIAEPEYNDVDVNLLYQTRELKDIAVGKDISSITKEQSRLNIIHLSPDAVEGQAIETPHYIKTLRNDRPLKKEGMIKLDYRTEGTKPIVMANILTTNDPSDVTSEVHNGYISGKASGKNFAYNTLPGELYTIENMQTDATALTWDNENIFVASATTFHHNDISVLKSEHPVTFELTSEGLKYYLSESGKLTIKVSGKPAMITLDGNSLNDFIYDENSQEISLMLIKGEGNISLRGAQINSGLR